jgi:ribose 5-phosphate isomerase A
MNDSSAEREARSQQQQQRAAEHAVGFVRSGMVVGLGSGRTAHFALRKLAESLRNGHLQDVVGVPSSRTTEALARELEIPLSSLEEHPRVDLTIDGADEVDPHLNLIKGGGGALLREKILAQASAREIIVVDESKLSPALGTLRALPVEVVPFGWRGQLRYLERLGAEVELRRAVDGQALHTDQGNLILDCRFGPLPPPALAELALQLRSRAGIVEHGLFIGLASDLVSAGESGTRHVTREALQRERAL